jgi:hypothetical protein
MSLLGSNINLISDQVEADPSEVNLTAYETFFQIRGETSIFHSKVEKYSEYVADVRRW